MHNDPDGVEGVLARPASAEGPGRAVELAPTSAGRPRPGAPSGQRASQRASQPAAAASRWQRLRAWRPRPEWTRACLTGLVLWAISRVALIVATYFALLLPTFHTAATPGQLLDAWRHWDVNWYVQIAQTGYNVPQATAFFPLYPLMIAATHFVVPGLSYFASALILSNVALLVALILLIRLVEREFTAGIARTAALLLLTYPAAFYLATGYAESVFLMWTVGAFLALRSGRWVTAGLLAAAATLTRPTGGMLIFPFLWEYARQSPVSWATLRQRGWHLARWRADFASVRVLLVRLGAIAAMPLAVALYAGYLYKLYGQPFLFKTVEGVYWSHHTALPTTGLAMGVSALFHQAFTTFTTARGLLDVVPILLFLLVIVFGFRRVPVAYMAYAIPVVLLSLIAPIPGSWPLQSGFRYVMVAFPVFIVLAIWCKRWPNLEVALIYLLLPLQGILVLLFLHNAWII